MVVGGEDLADTFKPFETLEFTAKTILQAKSLGQLKVLDGADTELARERSNELDICEEQAPCSRE